MPTAIPHLVTFACLAVITIFVSCDKDPDPDSPDGYESEFTIPEGGKVPSMVVPDEIRTLFEGIMPLHSGKTPPNIHTRKQSLSL